MKVSFGPASQRRADAFSCGVKVHKLDPVPTNSPRGFGRLRHALVDEFTDA